MYTDCTIRWIDDGSEMDVVIKALDILDERDDLIFFYGLDRTALLDACASGSAIEGEWKVVSVGESFDTLE